LRRIRRPERWYLAGALLILLIVSFVSYQDWTAFQRSAPQVQHSRALLQEVEQVLSYAKDAEDGQRGFVLTGDPQYLDTYNTAIVALPSELQKLHQLVAGEAALRTKVTTLEGLITEKLSELKYTVDLRQNEGFKAALSAVQSNRGKQAMDDVRRVAQDLQNEVYAGLMRSIRERQQEGSRTQLTSAIGGALLFLFLLLATFDIVRATGERDRLIVDLEAAKDRATASRDLLHTTLTSIADAVVATDESGRVTFINGVAERLTGWKQTDAEGQPLPMVFPIVDETTRQPANNPALEALRKGTIAGLGNHTVLISHTGAERPIDSSAAPIRNTEGNVIGAVLVFRDISGLRRSEEQLQHLNRALLRTNQDLQQFAYAASHDLKEPLRTVATCVQLLRAKYSGQKLDAGAEELMDVAVTGAQRMHELVEALLEYSRAGEVVEPAVQLVRVDQVVEDALRNLRGAITESNASVSIGPLPEVRANPMHLAHVFQNLMSNALKYRSAQPPRIVVSAAENGRDWVFTVADNGVGIPPEYQAQIFGIFKRLHGDEYPGTGIGLAICKKIVDRQGGAIWVESEPGKGSRFSFTLSGGRDSLQARSSAASEDRA